MDILEEQSLVLSTWRTGKTAAKEDRIKVFMITATGLDILFPPEKEEVGWR